MVNYEPVLEVRMASEDFHHSEMGSSTALHGTYHSKWIKSIAL